MKPDAVPDTGVPNLATCTVTQTDQKNGSSKAGGTEPKLKPEGGLLLHQGGASSRGSPILQALCNQQEVKAHVMTVCRLIDPGMGYAGITAANAGDGKVNT